MAFADQVEGLGKPRSGPTAGSRPGSSLLYIKTAVPRPVPAPVSSRLLKKRTTSLTEPSGSSRITSPAIATNGRLRRTPSMTSQAAGVQVGFASEAAVNGGFGAGEPGIEAAISGIARVAS